MLLRGRKRHFDEKPHRDDSRDDNNRQGDMECDHARSGLIESFRSILRMILIVMKRRTSLGRWRFRMKRKKLNYRFHNPNSAEATEIPPRICLGKNVLRIASQKHIL